MKRHFAASLSTLVILMTAIRPDAGAQEAYVKGSNTEIFDEFGSSFSISAGGSQFAVGAYYEDSATTGVDGVQTDNSTLESGAVYLFSR